MTPQFSPLCPPPPYGQPDCKIFGFFWRLPLQVCRQIWHFVVTLSVCIVHFQVIWGPGKFGLKKVLRVTTFPPRVTLSPFFYSFFYCGASLSHQNWCGHHQHPEDDDDCPKENWYIYRPSWRNIPIVRQVKAAVTNRVVTHIVLSSYCCDHPFHDVVISSSYHPVILSHPLSCNEIIVTNRIVTYNVQS